MRTRLLVLFAAVASAVVLAACGDSDSGKPAANLDVTTGPAKMVPADAPIYFQAVLQPDGDQAAAIKDVVKTVSNGEVTDPGAEIIKALEGESQSDGPPIDFDKDIKPWLGKSAAVFATGFSDTASFAVVIDSKDEAKAQDFVKAQSEGEDGTPSDYKGAQLVPAGDGDVATTTDNYVIVGDEEAVKAALDVEGKDSLATDPIFEKTAKTVVGSLAFGYLSVEGLEDAIKSGAASEQQLPGLDLGGGQDHPQALLDLFGVSGLEAVGFGAEVRSDAVALDFAAVGAEQPLGDASSLLPGLPADALVAIGIGDIGANGLKSLEPQFDKLDTSGEFKSGLDEFERQAGIDVEDDLLAWMGDGAVFARGSSISDAGGALVVETKDPAKTEEAIGKLEQVVGLAFGAAEGSDVRTSPITGVDVDKGFTLQAPELGLPVQIAVKGDRFVIAIGNDALKDALDPSSKLGDADAFKDATGILADGSKPQLFVDIPQIIGLVDAFAAGDPDYTEAKPYLKAFGALVAGSRTSNGSPASQIAIGIND